MNLTEFYKILEEDLGEYFEKAQKEYYDSGNYSYPGMIRLAIRLMKEDMNDLAWCDNGYDRVVDILEKRPPVSNCNTPGYIEWNKRIDAEKALNKINGWGKYTEATE